MWVPRYLSSFSFSQMMFIEIEVVSSDDGITPGVERDSANSLPVIRAQAPAQWILLQGLFINCMSRPTWNGHNPHRAWPSMHQPPIHQQNSKCQASNEWRNFCYNRFSIRLRQKTATTVTLQHSSFRIQRSAPHKIKPRIKRDLPWGIL